MGSKIGQSTLDLKKRTPTYVMTNSEIVRIDHILDIIDDCVQAVVEGSYIQLPEGLYSEAELDEYEAHLVSELQEENTFCDSDLADL